MRTREWCLELKSHLQFAELTQCHLRQKPKSCGFTRIPGCMASLVRRATTEACWAPQHRIPQLRVHDNGLLIFVLPWHYRQTFSWGKQAVPSPDSAKVGTIKALSGEGSVILSSLLSRKSLRCVLMTSLFLFYGKGSHYAALADQNSALLETSKTRAKMTNSTCNEM